MPNIWKNKTYSEAPPSETTPSFMVNENCHPLKKFRGSFQTKLLLKKTEVHVFGRRLQNVPLELYHDVQEISKGTYRNCGLQIYSISSRVWVTVQFQYLPISSNLQIYKFTSHFTPKIWTPSQHRHLSSLFKYADYASCYAKESPCRYIFYKILQNGALQV